MEHIPSWKAERSSGSQQIPRILWDPNIQYLIHKPVVILSQINPVQPTSSYFLKNHFHIILQSTSERSKWSLFPTLNRKRRRTKKKIFKSFSSGPLRYNDTKKYVTLPTTTKRR